MQVVELVGRILTPVHIGTGETIDPLEYIVQNGKLIRFNPSAVIADLPAAERERLEGILERGELQSLQNFFRNHVDPARHAVAVIDAGPGVVERFQRNIGRPTSQLKVRPMIRNLHTGRPFIPGSSIKGAIRTAVLSWLVNQEPLKSHLEQELKRTRSDREKARLLQELALDYEMRRIERDPFRALKVSDAELPQNCTRIEEVFNVKPGRQQDMPVDMWEYVRAECEGFKTTFRVTIRLDDHLFEHPNAGKHLGRPLNWNDIVQACNRFYTDRLRDEDKRFFLEAKLARSLILKPFLTPGENGRMKFVEPTAPNLLLRLGRFNQFESKSVDGFREGWNVRARQPIKVGSTRNLVPITVKSGGQKKGVKIPFGWVLLSPATS